MNMTIVIPMAGISKRFTQAGYSVPKYMLEIENKSLFEHSLESFKNYFEESKFLFIARNIHETKKFINEKVKIIGIKKFEIIIIDNPTKGQADTVSIGINKSNIDCSEPILIFNIDTIRPNYSFPHEISKCDGLLEVFIDETGDNWSFIEPIYNTENKVARTTEKNRISNLCSTGLYFFRNKKLFDFGFKELKESGNNKELYVAPMYNNLISNNNDVRYYVIKKEEVIFCGTPKEYIAYKKYLSK